MKVYLVLWLGEPSHREASSLKEILSHRSVIEQHNKLSHIIKRIQNFNANTSHYHSVYVVARHLTEKKVLWLINNDVKVLQPELSPRENDDVGKYLVRFRRYWKGDRFGPWL